MSPLRVDLVEYDGSRTPLWQLAAEGVVLALAMLAILAAVWIIAGGAS